MELCEKTVVDHAVYFHAHTCLHFCRVFLTALWFIPICARSVRAGERSALPCGCELFAGCRLLLYLRVSSESECCRDSVGCNKEVSLPCFCHSAGESSISTSARIVN